MVKSNGDTLKNHAYNVIRAKIMNCELEPGAPISEHELIEELGISRTPIREALSRLEAEHLVSIFPKRGIFVTEVSLKDVMDIYMLRETIEPIAARLATAAIDRDKLLDLKRRYYDVESHHDLQTYIDADLEFHRLVAVSTGNLYLEQILTNLYAQNSRTRIISKVRNKAHEAEAWAEVKAIINALMEGDPELSEDLMKRHVHNGNLAALAALGIMASGGDRRTG